QIFYVDSNRRLTGSGGSDFTYSINFDKNLEFDRVAVLQILIPVSYYAIQQGLNTFTLVEGASNATITLTAGNYNRRSLASTLSSLLTSLSPHGWTYSVTFPATGSQCDTGLYTFSVTGNGGIQPQFVFTNGCYEQLGFSQNSTNSFVSNSLNSTGVIS